MSTIKFQGPSPYTVKTPPPPEEDIPYFEYLDDLQSNVSTKREALGVALFGINEAGTIHLSNLVNNKRVKLLYVVDNDEEELNRVKNYFNLHETKFIMTEDQGAVFRDLNVNCVVCAFASAIPTFRFPDNAFTNEGIVVQALLRRKAVFCERPLAETVEEVQDLYKLAKEVNAPLLYAFDRPIRFDDSFASVRNRVKQGDVGKVLIVKTCSRDSSLPDFSYLDFTASDAIFHDYAVDDIDQIISILGEYPSKVVVLATANIPEIAEVRGVDTVAITLSFDSGAIAMIDLSRQCAYGYDQRLEVFGEKGMLKVENRAPIQSVEEYTHDYVKTSPIYYSVASRYKDAYRREMEHFLDVVEGKSQPLVDGKVLLALSKIATACGKSLKTGSVVDLKWSQEEWMSILLNY